MSEKNTSPYLKDLVSGRGLRPIASTFDIQIIVKKLINEFQCTIAILVSSANN